MTLKRTLLLVIFFNLVRLVLGLLMYTPFNLFNMAGIDSSNISILPDTDFLNSSSVIGGFGGMLVIQVIVFLLAGYIIPSNRKYWVIAAFSSLLLLYRGVYLTGTDLLYNILWLLSILFFYKAIFKNKSIFWILAGLSVCGAYLLAYNSYFLLIGIMVFLIFSTKKRTLLLTWKPYFTVVLLVVAAFLSYKTSFGNGFVPGSIESAARPYELCGFSVQTIKSQIYWQLLLLMPVFFVGIWWVVLKYSYRILSKPNQINIEIWFLLSFFMPMFLGYYLLLPFNVLHFDYLLPAYITGFIISGKLLRTRWLMLQLALGTVGHIFWFFV